MSGDTRIMTDDIDGDPKLLVSLLEGIVDRQAGFLIYFTGGFICEQQTRTVRQ